MCFIAVCCVIYVIIMAVEIYATNDAGAVLLLLSATRDDIGVCAGAHRSGTGHCVRGLLLLHHNRDQLDLLALLRKYTLGYSSMLKSSANALRAPKHAVHVLQPRLGHALQTEGLGVEVDRTAA